MYVSPARPASGPNWKADELYGESAIGVYLRCKNTYGPTGELAYGKRARTRRKGGAMPPTGSWKDRHNDQEVSQLPRDDVLNAMGSKGQTSRVEYV